MDLNALKALDGGDLKRAIEALEDQRYDTARRDRTGYGQDYSTEMNEIDATIAKLRAAQ